MNDRTLFPVLYAASVKCLEDPALYDVARMLSSAGRRDKAEKYKKLSDRCLSYGAEMLLRYALLKAGQEPLLCFSYGEHGKPFLKNNPIMFSLSHSGEWVLCAVSDHEIGCDIEKIDPVDLQIAKRFFTPAEYERISFRKTPEARTESFFRYWTLKESCIKQTGLGLSQPLNSFEIIPGKPVTAVKDGIPLDVTFKEYSDIPGYCCAVCTAGSCSMPLRIVDLGAVLLHEFA